MLIGTIFSYFSRTDGLQSSITLLRRKTLSFIERLFRGVIGMVTKKSEKIKEYEALLSEAIQRLDRISQDRSVPRNIRRATTEAIEVLRDERNSYGVRSNKAISILNDIVNDINMPFPTRSEILLVVGLLEKIKD